jgi:hypothetical protein
VNERHTTRADQIREAMGTADRRPRIAVTGTRKRSGRPIRLHVFLKDRDSQSWSLDTAYLNERHLGKGDPAGADKVISTIRSRRHGRLGPNRDAWHLAEGVDVPISIMSVILDAHQNAGRSSVAMDRVKAVVSQLGSEIRKFSELRPEKRQHAQNALYKEILRRCANFE